MRILLLSLIGALALGAQTAHATPINWFFVHDAKGALATDTCDQPGSGCYTLRLDGFSGGTQEVTFTSIDVEFHINNDGTALLSGLLEINRGPETGSQWELHVLFDPVPAGDLNSSDIVNFNPALRYWHLNPNDGGVAELVNVADASDYAHLFEHPNNPANKPFRLGTSGSNGPIPDVKCPDMIGPCESAAMWLEWERSNNTSWQGDTADFIFAVQPIPEPSSLVLFSVGALVVGGAVRRQVRR